MTSKSLLHGERHKSDKFAEGNSEQLSRLLLSAPDHIEQDEHETDEIISRNSIKEKAKKGSCIKAEKPQNMQPYITMSSSQKVASAKSLHAFFELFLIKNFLGILQSKHICVSMKKSKH